MTVNAVSFMLGIVASNFIAFFPYSITAISILSGSILLLKQQIKKTGNNFPAEQRGHKTTLMLILLFASGLLYNHARHTELPELTLPVRVVRSPFFRNLVVLMY